MQSRSSSEKCMEQVRAGSSVLRVNLIGEQTDYNDGFVLPAAVDFYSHAAIGEVATAFAFKSLGTVNISLLDVARLCQRAENTYTGARQIGRASCRERV